MTRSKAVKEVEREIGDWAVSQPVGTKCSGNVRKKFKILLLAAYNDGAPLDKMKTFDQMENVIARILQGRPVSHPEYTSQGKRKREVGDIGGSDPKVVKKYNDVLNPIYSERKRALALAAAASNSSLHGITRFSDTDLHLVSAACLHRPDVASLVAPGSHAYMYVYQWTAEDEAGWAATPESLLTCEQKESLTHILSAKNPLLRVRDSSVLRNITRNDIFYVGSEAYIIRLAISPLLCDITEIEKVIHVILSNGDVVGFIGHRKNGGSPARQKHFVYGVSILVIPDLTRLHLEVNKKYRVMYEHELAQYGGREGRVVLPAAPPATFVLPPFEAPPSLTFVLGGPRFLFKRCLISAEEAAAADVTASQGASQGASQDASQDDDEASVVSWDFCFGDWVYFSGATPTVEQVAAIGEERCVVGALAKKRPMSLLVVKAISDWRKTPKGKWAIENYVPVITYKQLDEYLDGEEEEEEGGGAGA